VLAVDRLVEVNDLSGLATGLLNDMVVDTRGRAFVGDTGFRPATGEPQAPGRIIMAHPNGDARVVAEGLAFPNGMAVTDDGSTLYVAETLGNCVTAFTVLEDGRLVERRTVVGDLDFRPDGLCLDDSGSLWIAGTWSSKFVGVQSDGTTIAEVPSPAGTAVACVFAGPERDHLVLCSADTSPDQLSRGISRGRIDLVDVGSRGAGRP
jgi:sugar lactone lactonase YvrE